MNSIIDTSVIVIFSVFIMVIGLLFSRTGRNLKSFFAGGEAVPGERVLGSGGGHLLENGEAFAAHRASTTPIKGRLRYRSAQSRP